MSLEKNYARALFESLAGFASAAESVHAELLSFEETIQATPNLKRVLEGPVIPSSEKLKVVEALCAQSKMSQEATRFLGMLATKGRFRQLPRIVEVFGEVRAEAMGGVLGEVETADEISDADLKKLADAFAKKLGKTVEFQVKVNPDLMAGVRVTVNGVTYDGSMKNRIQRLRDQVVQGTGTVH